ncbi:MAG: lycopene cyclase family protein [Ruminococcus sp.]
MKYDLIIVGAGPAGIFTALERIKNKPDSKIVIIEKGQSIEKRHCPKIKTQSAFIVSRIVTLQQAFRVQEHFPTESFHFQAR